MYNQKTLAIFKNPTNAGGLQGANGVAKVVDKTFGDVIKIYLKVNDNEVIEQARFKTMGSVASIAVSNVLIDLITNKSLEEAKQVSNDNILEVIGSLPHERLCEIETAIDALKGAVADYYKRKEKEQKAQNN